ncbi:chemotaxis protein MotB [Caloramator sp. E03]|uniref:OmpA family protein n=1 Tax=Caloramator sp. E03 TaxID=2576307 RepID=UPI00110FFBAF|nr:OmpA family protein [Caloramator sp. E03]QCX32343.1 chemotaxis protein MotB [Caloramator sp. E03]
MSKKKEVEKKQISQEWLTTYSDMVTLILTFFVLLYSFSQIDNIKFKAIAMSLAKSFGATSGYIVNGGNIAPTPVEANPALEKDSSGDISLDNVKINETEKIYKQVENFIKANKLQGKVSIKQDARGVVIELQEKILFDSGSAQIKKESFPLLEKISELLSSFPNEVIVEGHTDNVPINRGYYQTNWELSTDRAVKVVRYFTEVRKLNPTKFMAVGCGEFKPIDTNSTAEGRQKNRRVNILIVTSEKENKK